MGGSGEERFFRRKDVANSSSSSSSSSSPATTAATEAEVVRPRGPNYANLAPIFYAPCIPLIRIGLRGRLPQPTIDKLFGGAVLLALSHAGYIMAKSDV